MFSHRIPWLINACNIAVCRKAVSRSLASQSCGKRPRVAIIGCGWGGYRAAKELDKLNYDVLLISPRNHFLFTPLLASTAVGTLEFRCIQEPVRTIPDLTYYQATCKSIDFEHKELNCQDYNVPDNNFKLKFDALIIGAGSETNTFNCPGVDGNPLVFFLKQLSHARAIRNRLIECFEH